VNKKIRFYGVIAALVFCLFACPVPENEVPHEPVSGIRIIKNQDELPISDSSVNPALRGSFEILEGRSVILGARLLPEGVTGGIHWQSSGRGIVELSGLTGPELVISGANGGRTTVKVMARNSLNEVYIEAECGITVIPSSFFKWSFSQDGWLDMPALSNAIVGKINEMVVRSGETPIVADTAAGALVLEGPGVLMIGSVLSSPTNSPFPSDPLYDMGGALDFYEGPVFSYQEWQFDGSEYQQVQKKKRYPLWNGRARISVDYETENPARSPLRIQVNNNTLERNNASAVSNWLVTELASNAARSGTLSGIFNANDSLPLSGVTLTDVLSNSFVCLALPEGKILIRGIRIESAD